MQEKLKEKFGIILMMDALGVSKYSINECRNFLRKQNDLKNLISAFNSGILLHKKDADDGTYDHIINSHTSIFGDTIIICYPLQDANILSTHTHEIFNVSTDAAVIVGWGISEGILFRGCITVGKYLCNENSIIGPAIFDAVDWYEAADWFGVILSPRSQMWVEANFAQEKVEYGRNVLIHKSLIEYQVPLSKTIGSNNTKKLWTVPWPRLFMEKESPLYHKSLTPRANILDKLYKIPQSKGTESKFENSIIYFDNYAKIFIHEEESSKTE